MASTSIPKIFKYDVYLSFMGQDTRKTFVDHLYHALVSKGIITYKDDERIERGGRIKDQLIKAIEDSRFHIIVFSKNYASSSWCLNELVKIMECRKTSEHIACPVFYDVGPSEVRRQSGAVGEAFAKHVHKETAGIWRDALKEAADLTGWDLKNTFDGHEARCIRQIVEHISQELDVINVRVYENLVGMETRIKNLLSSSEIGSDEVRMIGIKGIGVDENLVGMETRVKNLLPSLEIGSDEVRMIGIKGMGGSGKTTLSRAVFDLISVSFERACFVEDVRYFSSSYGIKALQRRVLSDVLHDPKIDVQSVNEGKHMMKRMFGSTKVLLLLDDVDRIDQLEVLAGNHNWFKPGSRIIITTRDEQVLIAHGVKIIHDINLLTHEEAICLFSRYAFKREIPLQGYEELSENVVDYAAGLPLTIKVLGSFLCGQTQNEWQSTIERLETIPLPKILKSLELSYDALEDELQQIFLDVACILTDEMKDEAIRVLESCGLPAEIGLRILEQKSLIIISNDGRLVLHNQIKEMGRNIVRRSNPEEPSKHTRLWINEEIEDILVNDLGTKATRSIKLLNTHLSPNVIMSGLTKMKGLRFLYVDNGYKYDAYASPSSYKNVNLPETLRCLYWPGCPLSGLPETFQANNLVNLGMPHSNICQLWKEGERKVLNKLRFLNLTFSRLKTFDLGLTPCLERLDLRGCSDFVELHMPDECPKLQYLSLSGTKLSKLNVGRTPNLVTLDLSKCNDFVELHMPDEYPKLKFLSLSGYKSSNIKLWLTLHLERLESLEELTLSITNIEHLPDSICMLKYLKSLELDSCLRLEQLPEHLGRLECLEKLCLSDCISLRDIPNSICDLKCLKYFHLSYCNRVRRLPEELGLLGCLEELNIEGTGIEYLPQSILQLKGLHIVWSRRRLKQYGFTSLKGISRYTASCYV